MKLRRRTPSPPQETIITLIDVVFFLLVFFMLIGRLDATAPFETDPPIAISGNDLPAGGITVAVSESGDLALDGREIERSDLVQDINASLTKDPARLVRINAHKNTELRHVLPLISEIESDGAVDVVLVVTPQEQP